jgi:acyl-CoA synthetase (AMP-forming)/AMP-acid ligase II
MRQGFWTNFEARGDAPALVFAGQPAISYAELATRMDKFAKSLASGKLIAIEAGRSEHPIIAYLAALKAGCAVALLPPGCPQAMEQFRQRFSPDLIYRQIGGRWRLDEQAVAASSLAHRDLALILITSGSSGNGKAVRLSSQAVDANALSIGQYLELDRSDRAALVLPWHYSYGLSVLNSHLATGGSVFVAGSVLDAGFAAQLRDYGCTNLSGVPSSFDLMESIGFREEILPDLRFMTVAGGRMEPAAIGLYERHLAARGQKFFVMYGQTEATARIAYLPAHLAASHPDRIGRPIPGGEIRLVDADGQPVNEPGVAGELVYRGPNVMMGYGRDRADLARGSDIDELRTGDFAVRDKDGLYRIVGRLSRMSKIAGIRIGHDTMETALAAAGIKAAVVGDDQSLLAVFTSAHSTQQVCQALAKAASLPLASVNAVARRALPLLCNGKIDYQTLRDLLAAHRPKLAKGIAEAFDCAFFPRRTVSSDSFLSLGGDSLRHLQLSM